MKRKIIVGLSILVAVCLIGCGDASEDYYVSETPSVQNTESEVKAQEPEVEASAEVSLADTGNEAEPMNDEQKEAFKATYQDFIDLTGNFVAIYSKDEVAQSDVYEAYINECTAIIEEIDTLDIDTLSYDDAKVYVDIITEYFEKYQTYADEIKTSLGL